MKCVTINAIIRRKERRKDRKINIAEMFLIKITVAVTVTFCVTTGQLESSSSQKFRTNSTESLSSLSLAQSVRGVSLNHLQNVSQSTESKAAVSKNDQASQDDRNDKSPEVPIIPLEDESVNENQNKSSHDTHRTDLRKRQPDQTVSFRRKGSQRLRPNSTSREISVTKAPSRRTELQQLVSWPQEQRTTAQITVQNPRVHQRKIALRRVIQRKSEAQPQTEHQERPRLKGTTVGNEAREANAFTQLDSHRFQQSDQQGQQQRHTGIQQSQPKFSASNRTPVFDIARPSESQTGHFKTRHIGRGRYLPTAEPTDPVPSVLPATSDVDASRSTKPITFDLGFRRRIRYNRPTQNRTLRIQEIPHQGEFRTRPLVRYVRPNYSPRQQNVSKSNNSDVLLKSGNESESGWIPKPGPQRISAASTSPATPLASTQSLEKTIGNTTLSLQHARQLFARAQERYKALSGENSSYAGNTTTNLKATTVEPEGQYSSSYSKIRQTDGSITRSIILSSSTTPPSSAVPPTTVSSSSSTGNSYNTTVSANLSAEIHYTTASKPLEEKSASNTSEYSLTTVSLNNITSLSNNTTSLLNNATLLSYNATSVSNNVTNEPSLGGSSTEDSGSSYFTTLPPPVYKNVQFDSSQFSNLQNFTPFGLGKFNQHQNVAGFFQPPGSSAASGSGSQSLGLSGLFGLGNIPSLGSGLGSLSGFGVGQRFSSLNAGANPAEQSGSTGLDLGYLGLLSGLSGLGLGQIGGTSSAPELSLPSIPQDSSGQQTNTGLGFLSGLPSLSLSGLGSLSSLGSFGSLPGLGGLGSNSGSPTSGLTGTGLSGFGLARSGGVSGLGGIPSFGIPGSTLSGLSGSGSSTSNLGTILGKLSPTDKLASVIGQSSGAASSLPQKITSVEDTLAAAKTPAFLPSADISVLSSDTAASDPLTK